MTEENIVECGCVDCGEICPYTDKTTPRLTMALSDEWYEVHRLICPAR